MSQWKKFPHDDPAFHFEGNSLFESWSSLHAGDCVAFPDAKWVSECLEQTPGAAPQSFDEDVDCLALTIQDAWRSFHAGQFQHATDLAGQCGGLAHAAANKSAGIYANYLEPDESTQRACYLAAAERAEEAIKAFPNDPNSHYFHAFNLGRYSQSISIIKALGEGIGGKVQNSLQNALALEPDHAEANTAMGMYHAEIIDKVGKMVGNMDAMEKLDIEAALAEME
jgi:hypothetical protein